MADVRVVGTPEEIETIARVLGFMREPRVRSRRDGGTAGYFEVRVPRMICLDCETTGLDYFKDEILTLSIVDWAGATLYDGRFKPARQTEWPEAERVNGISPESVAQCPPISQDLEEIQGIVDSADKVIGYNVTFDQRFLEAAGVRFGRKAICDTMLEYAELAGDWDEYHQDWRWWRLTEAADAIGYEWTGAAHGSLADALATLAVQKWVERERGRELLSMA